MLFASLVVAAVVTEGSGRHRSDRLAGVPRLLRFFDRDLGTQGAELRLKFVKTCCLSGGERFAASLLRAFEELLLFGKHLMTASSSLLDVHGTGLPAWRCTPNSEWMASRVAASPKCRVRLLVTGRGAASSECYRLVPYERCGLVKAFASS